MMGSGARVTGDGQTDAELVKAWAAGDERAGREVFERHRVDVRRFLRSKLSEGVEDVLHDAFVGLLGAAKEREIEDARAYLFGVARRLVLQVYRKKSRHPTVEPIEERSIADLDPGVSSALQGRQEERLLLRALREIPLDDQIAIELHYWARFSITQAAEILEMPAGTLKWRLSRARGRLRDKLTELAKDPDAVATTMDELEHWAQRVHEQAVDDS